MIYLSRIAISTAYLLAFAALQPTPVVAADGKADSWDDIYQQRLRWWSLQPVQLPRVPDVKNDAWCRSDIDRFILAKLEAQGIAPVKEADQRTLIRRLTFALTGLPPTPAEIESYLKESSATPQAAYDKLVDRLLESEHFGERWARHWMDVVHYADTHGYEWDHPAKGAWQYRDYLIRAFNSDLPFQQLVLEHIAGDLLEREKRVEWPLLFNESIIGTVAMRLGERRHGDSAEFEGIHQEAIENVVDTIGKAFLATTVACARCHDHKLDAIAQRDYYALAGVFMSSRWVCRVADGRESNYHARAAIGTAKSKLRKALGDAWRKEMRTLPETEAWKKLASDTSGKPESLAYPLVQLSAAVKRGEKIDDAWKKLAAEYAKLRRERMAANAKNTKLFADFTNGQVPPGWNVEGFGLNGGFVYSLAFIVADKGPEAVRQFLPPGLYTHGFSTRLNGALRSPLLNADTPSLSFQVTAGGLASAHVVVDNAMFPESRYRFLDFPNPTWLTLTTLPEEIRKGRRVYIELNTKAFNNYYPPRVGLVNKYTPEQQNDPRSWFGITKVYAGPPPQDELGRYDSLFNDQFWWRAKHGGGRPPATWDEVGNRLVAWLDHVVNGSIVSNGEDAIVMNELLQRKLLSNRADLSPEIAASIEEYRIAEGRLDTERVVGAIADYKEGRDERIAVRGSYTDFGEAIPRGNIRFLTKNTAVEPTPGSGRLELAQSIAADDNPLTARVYVNRVWHYLFGEGLVRTVDDFGHLGEKPSHPELLDYLAAKFVEEGWSTKKLIRMMVLSSTWRQSSTPNPTSISKDPENRLWHHYPLRRLEAEAIRDSMLAVSGRLDAQLYGPPIDPYRRAVDPDKRLFCGPLDGNGRRSIYTKMTLMEPPKFLALFNQPIPKVTVGRRDVTNVPDQALALLNDPFVLGQAEFRGKRLLADGANSVDERLRRMFVTALGRPPEPAEMDRFRALANQLAELHQVAPADLLSNRAVWQDIAHAVFNLKEFIYVR